MKSSKDTENLNNTEQKNGKGKLNYFLIFLICWLVVVTGFIAWFLLRFNDFAAKYEEQYQATLPIHTAEKVTEHFSQSLFPTSLLSAQKLKALLTAILSFT